MFNLLGFTEIVALQIGNNDYLLSFTLAFVHEDFERLINVL
jgi:hypothetical protein